MSFERIYDSTWHHPVLFWAVGGPVLVLLLLLMSGDARAGEVRRLRHAHLRRDLLGRANGPGDA